MGSPSQRDAKLIRKLNDSILQKDPDWTCTGRADRTAAHGLIQYPAMMVPAMQRDILDLLFDISPDADVVLDPFVGSATALTETLAAGRSFLGFDINPLAILIARVKSAPWLAHEYEGAAEQVLGYIDADRHLDYAVSFPNQRKWFRKSNSIGLSKIRRAIQRLDSLACRRFMWVTLAEAIRKCSNSRTSTYKLHIRPEDEIERLDGMAVPTFKLVLLANVQRMKDEKTRLESAGILLSGRMKNKASVWLGDICSPEQKKKAKNKVDIVLTSPPYGDNRTTVPYGQFSYLALRWIPLEDIDPSVKPEMLETTHTLDTASVGGSARMKSKEVEEISDISPSFAKMYKRLSGFEGDAAKRWASYCRDLSRSLDNIASTVKPDGYLVWTIGQRRMNTISAPLADVLDELHDHFGATPVTTVKRKIPTKRMPTHNSHSALMQTEHVCFYRKRAA